MRQTILAATLTVSLFFPPNLALSDDLSDLKTEIKKMEERDQTLREELEKQKEATDRLLKKMEALENENIDAGLSNGEDSMTGNHGEHPSAGHPEGHSFADIPKLKISGFGDMGFSAATENGAHSKTFKLGE
ncbi:MAG TPA: hypothetical protein VFA47_13340, partial [Candidatus Manganitrophaceae bacterium]|nr:hypothetical protein [Candidatus Manganitrophaceae bacterium]